MGARRSRKTKPRLAMGLIHIFVDSRSLSAQTSFESPFLKGRARFGAVLCIAHHFVTARFLPTKECSSSTALRLRARRALRSCGVMELR